MGPARPLPARRRLARRPRRRVSSLLRRQPALFWALALASAATTFWVVRGAVAETTRGRAAYGDLVEVAIATTDLEAGTVIGPEQVEIGILPIGLVPDDALHVLPGRAAVRERVVAGEALVRSRLAPDGSIGVAAALEAGERAVAIPLTGHRPPLEVGQRVDVLATYDPSDGALAAPTRAVAERVEVLEVTETGITVAADLEAAQRIVTATAVAVVSVVVAPG